MRLASILALAILLGLAACKPPRHKETGAEVSRVQDRREHIAVTGGDEDAWLTDSGSVSETNFCAARLKLPLEPDPVWEYSFSAATFTSTYIESILHYDGTLALCGRSPQILLLEAKSGAELVNIDAFSRHGERTEESFSAISFTQGGTLVGFDSLAQVYAWDLGRGDLTSLWTIDSGSRGQLAFSSIGETVFYGYDTGVHALSVDGGTGSWVYPTPSRLAYLVTDGRGLLFACSTPNLICALDARDGAALWAATLDEPVQSMSVNPETGRLYVVTESAGLQCRSSKDGKLIWRYGWSTLADNYAEALGMSEHLPPYIPPVAACITPDAAVIALISGDVIMLDAEGEVRWQTRLDSALISAIAFENGVAVVQVYRPPTGQIGGPIPYDAFNTVRPAWAQEIPNGEEPQSGVAPGEEARQQRSQSNISMRVAVLDFTAGAMIGSAMPDVLPLPRLTPAGGCIVFGGGRKREDRDAGRREGSLRYITAYRWLE